MAIDPAQYTAVTHLTRKEDRRQFISDLGSAVSPTGLARELEINERSDNTCLNAHGTGLSAQVWFLHSRREGIPLISWHGAVMPLRGVVCGAWHNVNEFHRRKATSFPETLNQLIGCVVAGLAAARDGSAFVTPSPSLEKDAA